MPKLVSALFFAGAVAVMPAEAQDGVADQVVEGACAAVFEAVAGPYEGKFRYEVLTDFHVITTTRNGTFSVPAPENARVDSIMCGRSSPVPALYDFNVIRSGYDFFIGNLASSNRQFQGRLSKVDGRYTYSLSSGTLTAGEQAAVDRVLDFYQEAERALATAN